MKLSDIIYLLPELVLLAGAALVFLLDILWLRRVGVGRTPLDVAAGRRDGRAARGRAWR